MCGLCGFVIVDRRRAAKDEDSAGAMEDRVRRMAGAIAHRGPDAEGAWVDAEAGVALGHRRLSIVDLSPAGAQPMLSADRRWAIAYNGEIYNFQELRGELEAAGHRFRGHSDTEVLIEACARDGIAAVLPRLIGIFAIALWDREGRTLHLARDPLGVKPLYWCDAGGTLLFGSQPKVFRAHPAFDRAHGGAVDPQALAAYLRLGRVPAPQAMLKGVRALEPGVLLTFAPDRPPASSVYWDAADTARAGIAAPLDLPDEEAADALERLLGDAVGRQMVADVPLGAFLSGGIDSSTVVALMQARSARPVRTFTIGFREDGYDEAAAARAVAAHLGTDHTELTVGAGDALDLVPRLADWYDEPFADSSQLPTLLVSMLARRSVTVALSGDGGDESFAGYTRHLWGPALWRRMAGVPAPLRRGLAAVIGAVPPAGWDHLFALVPESRRPRQPATKLRRVAALLRAEGEAGVYRALTTQWELAGVPTADRLDDRRADGLDGVERMQLLDTVGYLPDGILTKVDRASMAVGLEARVPLLDPRVVAFAWRLPARQKVREGTGKWLLRRVLHRYVPAALVERPKSGFTVPVGAWLRGPLRAWAEELLGDARLRVEGLPDAGSIRRLWADHLSGRRDGEEALWTLLMFLAWRARWSHPSG